MGYAFTGAVQISALRIQGRRSSGLEGRKSHAHGDREAHANPLVPQAYTSQKGGFCAGARAATPQRTARVQELAC